MINRIFYLKQNVMPDFNRGSGSDIYPAFLSIVLTNWDGKPLKRLVDWVAVSDHPNEFGCYPKSICTNIETTLCFNGVRINTCTKSSTASAVYNAIKA